MNQAALVNPTILTWSRLRAGLSTEQLAKKLPVKTERLESWEAGKAKPTFLQAQKWANAAHIPFGFLFLPQPPIESLPLPDLRTVGGLAPESPSLNLLDTVKDAIRKQDWYLDYLQEHGRTHLDFVGRFTHRSPVKTVVDDIRKTLGINPAASRLDYDKYIRALIQAAEDTGILVMRSGVAVGNTHRKLEVSEFRGFAISNTFAPLIFINSSDAPAARLFTLIHELAHIWIGTSGVSNGSSSGRDEERFCNAVAGEFLAPEDVFRNLWDSNIHWEENLPLLATKFHISRLAVGRRAQDLGLISKEQYSNYYLMVLKAYQNKVDSSGNYYRTLIAKNSIRLSKAVLSETLSGRLLMRDAGNILGVQPANLRKLADQLTE